MLKPSKKDLEHGLELHKNSLVWDSYSFAPVGPFDCERIEQFIEEGATTREFKDNIEEMQSIGFLNKHEAMREYKDAWEASGINCIFQNAGAENIAHETEKLLLRFSRFTYLLDSQRDIYMRSAFPEDIETAFSKGLKTLCLSINAVPIPQGCDNEHEMLSFVRVFFHLGCRMMHLTYNRRNLIGDGCGEKSDGGLSEFGKAVIKEMNQVGVIPDVAHCGLRTSLEAAEVSEKPLVASHSSCYSLAPHCRAKTDEVIKAIVKTNGFLGICAIPSFLKGSGKIDAMLNHIDYVAENFGTDYVAIGTDVAYKMMSKEPKHYIKSKTRFPALWPENSFSPEYEINFNNNSLAWTNWPLFTVGLVQRGYSDNDIKKIIGLNVMRVCKQTMAASEYAAMIRQ